MMSSALASALAALRVDEAPREVQHVAKLLVVAQGLRQVMDLVAESPAADRELRDKCNEVTTHVAQMIAWIKNPAAAPRDPDRLVRRCTQSLAEFEALALALMR